jgi:hypothetical protein
MIAKLSALLFFVLLIAIAVVVFGRLSKRLMFDFRAIVLSVILAILALRYLYWKSGNYHLDIVCQGDSCRKSRPA